MIETCEQITAAEDQLIITIALVRRLATAAKSRPPDNEAALVAGPPSVPARRPSVTNWWSS